MTQAAYFAVGLIGAGLILLIGFAGFVIVRWLFKLIGRKLADLLGGSARF